MQDEREGENAEKNFFAALFTGGLLRKDYLMVSGLVLSPILMLVMCFLLQESVNAEVAWSIGAAISIPFLTYVRRPVGARVCGVWLLRGTGIEGGSAVMVLPQALSVVSLLSLDSRLLLTPPPALL